MKQISLSKKEEELIRKEIAISLSSYANTYKFDDYPDVQNNLWDDNCFCISLTSCRHPGDILKSIS